MAIEYFHKKQYVYVVTLTNLNFENSCYYLR